MSEEWWEPKVTDAVWIADTRKEYPEDTAELDDDKVRDEYANGCKYEVTWDHIGDAYEEYEQLANAYFKQASRITELEAQIAALKAGTTND